MQQCTLPWCSALPFALTFGLLPLNEFALQLTV